MYLCGAAKPLQQRQHIHQPSSLPVRGLLFVMNHMDAEFDLHHVIEELTNGSCIRLFQSPNSHAYLIGENRSPLAIDRASAAKLVREGKLELKERASLYSDWVLRDDLEVAA